MGYFYVLRRFRNTAIVITVQQLKLAEYWNQVFLLSFESIFDNSCNSSLTYVTWLCSCKLLGISLDSSQHESIMRSHLQSRWDWPLPAVRRRLRRTAVDSFRQLCAPTSLFAILEARSKSQFIIGRFDNDSRKINWVVDLSQLSQQTRATGD